MTTTDGAKNPGSRHKLPRKLSTSVMSKAAFVSQVLIWMVMTPNTDAQLTMLLGPRVQLEDYQASHRREKGQNLLLFP